MKIIIKLGFASSIIIIFLNLFLNGCNNKGQGSYQLTGDTLIDGEHLARTHCSSCHAFVPAGDLTKDVWRYHALPSMAKYAGITSYLGGYYKDPKDTSGLSFLEWQYVLAYYRKLAPTALSQRVKAVPLAKDLVGFTLKVPQKSNEPCYTTLVKVNADNHTLITCSNPKLSSPVYRESKIEVWDKNLKLKARHDLPSPGVDVLKSGQDCLLVACAGTVLAADNKNGNLIQLPLSGGSVVKKSWDEPFSDKIIDKGLSWPVQIIEGDFNHDGLQDLAVCESGNLHGRVALYTLNRDSTYRKVIVAEKPGAVQAIAGDFNHDGWIDLMVLYGVGDEGIWLYLNDHKGSFSSRNLLRFPPVYGSSSFQLVDLDKDGKLDLIYTCGYNFRDSRILKPYHGLYLFKNIGNWNFKQKWFYPINGCTKAIAADFKNNGRADIATIAFFADMQHKPDEEFIYFSQQSPFNFVPHTLPLSNYGRWMSMSVGDLNGDRKPDIILGNYSTGFLFQPDFTPFWEKDLPFIVLENNFPNSTFGK